MALGDQAAEALRHELAQLLEDRVALGPRCRQVIHHHQHALALIPRPALPAAPQFALQRQVFLPQTQIREQILHGSNRLGGHGAESLRCLQAQHPAREELTGLGGEAQRQSALAHPWHAVDHHLLPWNHQLAGQKLQFPLPRHKAFGVGGQVRGRPTRRELWVGRWWLMDMLITPSLINISACRSRLLHTRGCRCRRFSP